MKVGYRQPMQYACQSAASLSVLTRQLGLRFFVQAACLTAGGLIEAGGRGKEVGRQNAVEGRSGSSC
jgi:hypothetical protein